MDTLSQGLGLLSRISFDAEKLMADFPPKFRHRNKQIVFGVACPPGHKVEGTISYTRWKAMNPPREMDSSSAVPVESREDVFDYLPVGSDGRSMEWHVNFADPHLFMAYGGSLLAQDEMQVAEHPILGSLLEALYARGEQPMTIEDFKPTPVLVRGAERRVRIATDPNAAEGRPQGLYGNRFAAARTDVIQRAVTPINPPTISNLIAIAAPSGGLGSYTWDQINHILTTAFTGFRAAVIETIDTSPGARTLVHTGFWGCGAFGGNRVLMALLQILAAHLAGVDRLVFHTHIAAGTKAMAQAQGVVAKLLDRRTRLDVSDLLDQITAMALQWGESDGN